MDARGWIYVIVMVAAGLVIAYGPRQWPEPPTLISLATIVVSVVVATVQYLQWRTANQKVVVDLYDRRLKVFTNLEAAISTVVRHARVANNTFYDYSTAQADARFLFGADVKRYLQEMREALAWLAAYSDQVIDQSPERVSLIKTKHEKLLKVTKFYEDSPRLFGPYMDLSQKNTPIWRPW